MACRLQDKLSATLLDPATDQRLLSQLAMAWERLEERKRIFKMRPKPRDVDVSKQQHKVEAARVHYREPQQG
jgi:AmiR/NasT family two-component response regulator